MTKIMISVEKKSICFSKYNRQINEENLNNTNVINIKNLKFTEEYIIKNTELVTTFINLIILKFNINTIIIKNLCISELILPLIKSFENIIFINFTENKPLNYTISSILLENNNLEKIECYSLPNIMFYRFKKDQIKTRNKILSTSEFLKINNINTYSDLYNKDKIVIESIRKDDIQALIYFFNNNKNLKQIELKKYDKKNLEGFVHLINKNNLKNVSIIIHETKETTNEILKDIKLFDTINKKYKINIKIKYSKEYKEKNGIKEFNFIMLKNILISCIVLGIVFFLAYKIVERNNKNKVTENLKEIKEIIDEVDPLEEKLQVNSNITKEDIIQEENSYYKNYSMAYSELLKINDHTVGWIAINNTKIDYPVVQTKNNDYYLNHSFDKTKNSLGWIFVDYRNNMDVIDKNTIIYGHSMIKDGLMFSTLNNILKENWYTNEKNLTLNFSVKGKEIKWKVFSIYTIEVTNDYLQTEFIDDRSYTDFLNKITNRSIKNFDLKVNSKDKILTLSTCYKDDNHRIVLHAKMI